jgi:DUF1680 family protein
MSTTDYGRVFMQNIELKNVDITGGFWKEKQSLNQNVTAKAVYDRFKETHRFDALKCNWKEGDPNCPHVYWDSDIAKWLEGVSYIISKAPNEKLLNLAKEAIADIIANTDKDGYFNSHYLVVEKNERFTKRGNHELYCAGHLMEAAVAYYNATGKDDFLNAMCRYADYIEKVFVKEQSATFVTPGHQEIELALVKLYKATKEKRYLELAKFFVEKRANNELDKNHDIEEILKNYNQSDLPARELREAVGHSVRAMYYYCAMADLALEYDDDGLKFACERIFENVANEKMYITGGLGSSADLECFTKGYDLPTEKAYAETCAAIAFAMFCLRMQKFGADSRYANIVERIIYNGMLSGLSLDGKSFFYANPLEIDLKFRNRNLSRPFDERHPTTTRSEVFNCSCCPPNVIRFLASIGDYVYSKEDDTIFVNQFIENLANIDGNEIKIQTQYPLNGNVKILCKNPQNLAIRIPDWCENFEIDNNFEIKKGYAYIKSATEVNILFEMPVKFVCSNPKVRANSGKVAIMRGPVVYCAEALDNCGEVHDILIDINNNVALGDNEYGVPTLHTDAYRFATTKTLYSKCHSTLEKTKLKLIPYYAFANRGETEMLVWLLRKF